MLDNQRRGFGKRFGIVIGCRVWPEGWRNDTLCYHRQFLPSRKTEKNEAVAARLPTLPVLLCTRATIYRNNIPPWILSCRRREGEKMARMRRGGGSLCTATRLCNRRMTLVLNGTAGPKGKDRSISDGEAAEKQQRAPPFASFFPRSLRRLSRSAPRFIYNIIKY